MHLSVILASALSLILSADAAAISTNALCGSSGGGKTCLNSAFGNCCSQSGYCGSSADHCSPSKGCQSSYGTCADQGKTTSLRCSKNGACGESSGQTCKGSAFGSCCSQDGYCGSTSAHCGIGCNPKFGSCGAVSSSSVARISLTSAKSTSTKCSSSAAPYGGVTSSTRTPSSIHTTSSIRTASSSVSRPGSQASGAASYATSTRIPYGYPLASVASYGSLTRTESMRSVYTSTSSSAQSSVVSSSSVSSSSTSSSSLSSTTTLSSTAVSSSSSSASSSEISSLQISSTSSVSIAPTIDVPSTSSSAIVLPTSDAPSMSPSASVSPTSDISSMPSPIVSSLPTSSSASSSTPSPSPTPAACAGPYMTWATFDSVPQNNIIDIPGVFTMEQCCQACHSTPGCTYWRQFFEGTNCQISVQQGSTAANQCPLGVQNIPYYEGAPAWGPAQCGTPAMVS